MQIPTTYTTVQVGMRSLTGETVKYQINSEPTKEMNSTVDMYYKVKLVEGKLVIQNVSGGILRKTARRTLCRNRRNAVRSQNPPLRRGLLSCGG